MEIPTSVTIGTRGSPLALTQAEWVQVRLQEKFSQLPVAIKKIKVEGDTQVDQPLGDAGRKGYYTGAIEKALQAGEIDLAVHSLKDVPACLSEDFELAAVTARLDPRDVLISDRYARLADLPLQAKIGTASLRRLTQLKHRRPDLNVIPIRGNIETRLKKLRSQNLDAIVLAAAGLIRAQRQQEITDYLDPENIIPAVGQGSLAIEIRRGDISSTELVRSLNDPVAAVAAEAERSFLQCLTGGCQIPISAYAQAKGDSLRLIGFVANPQGSELLRGEVQGTTTEAIALGRQLADQLLEKGAQPIIDQILAHA